jgi:hypothetical protein
MVHPVCYKTEGEKEESHGYLCGRQNYVGKKPGRESLQGRKRRQLQPRAILILYKEMDVLV